MISDNLSKTILLSRFPLIFLIVLLHTIVLGQSYPHGIEIPAGKYALLDIVQFVSQREIGDVGISAFFLVSGFLFARGGLDRYVWKSRLCKRVHSLLIPYVIWNTLFLIWYIVLSRFIAVGDWGLADASLTRWLDWYMGFDRGPILAPLWFVRDLMVLNILALPVCHLLKHFKWLSLIILVVPFLFASYSAYTLSYIGIRSVTPYFMGAWFAVHGKEFIVTDKRCLLAVNVLLAVLIASVTVLHFTGNTCTPLQQVEILLGIFVIFSDINYFRNSRLVKCFIPLAQGAFFIYVAHMFIMNIPNKLWALILPVNGLTASMMQWLIPVVVCILLYWIYLLMRRLSPKVTSISVGGR